ncbi:MAG: hypothetical protein H7Y13_05515 [Sphingobacteriaceae bacterium]|nr:hypothetical protein [Sphingobacteriaceae bacterium]
MKTHLLLLFIFFNLNQSFGQLSLYNTRTLFDSFENPAQKAFYTDSSRKYAFNFLIPNLSVNAIVKGPAQTSFKSLFYKGVFNTNGLTIGGNEVNTIHFNENTYIAMFKIFKAVNYNRELGFSWQIKSYGNITITNETLALFNSFKLFNTPLYGNLFNNSGESIAYHQFGFTFREDYDRKLGLGIKLSYLSGIAYSSLDIDRSSLSFDEANKSYVLNMGGSFRSNILYDDPDKTVIIPGFKNPGLALTLSANYKLKNKLFLLANIKDLGFISWGKTPYKFTFNHTLNFTGGTKQGTLNKDLRKKLFSNPDLSKYTTKLDTRAELLLNKNLNSYQPNLLISKSIFEKGGDIALINTYRSGLLNLSLSTAYNLNNYFQIGGQFMLKTPNIEFFMGSDNVFKSYYIAKGVLTSNENIGKNHTAASVYLGFALKYGQSMERQQNASFIPVDDRDFKESFFKRLYKRVFKKKH